MPLIETPKGDAHQKQPLWYASHLFTDADDLCLRLAAGVVGPDDKAAALGLIRRLQKKLAEMKQVVESI